MKKLARACATWKCRSSEKAERWGYAGPQVGYTRLQAAFFPALDQGRFCTLPHSPAFAGLLSMYGVTPSLVVLHTWAPKTSHAALSRRIWQNAAQKPRVPIWQNAAQKPRVPIWQNAAQAACTDLAKRGSSRVYQMSHDRGLLLGRMRSIPSWPAQPPPWRPLQRKNAPPGRVDPWKPADRARASAACRVTASRLASNHDSRCSRCSSRRSLSR